MAKKVTTIPATRNGKKAEDGRIWEGFHGFRGTGDKLCGTGGLLHQIH